MRLHQLHLIRFRNHADTALEPEGRSVALIGHNGAGKTNILEALSLFSPGRGFRGAKLREITSATASHDGWVVASDWQAEPGALHIGTALDVASGQDKRLVKIDGERLKAQGDLCRHVSIIWQTPQMDGLFLAASSERRRYLDRLTWQFDDGHATRVNAYEKAMRERNRLLKTGSRDDEWLSVLERQMAEGSAAIAAARNVATARLHQAIEGAQSPFPAARITLVGEAEEALASGMAQTDYEAQLAATLAQRRGIDAQAGRATRGAHRTQMQVWFGTRSTEAADCSTGEQKALLLSLLLAQARARVLWGQTPPVLLLDEVVAHLDEARRRNLFAEIAALDAQAFLTGTDAADFSALKDAQSLSVAEGRVT